MECDKIEKETNNEELLQRAQTAKDEGNSFFHKEQYGLAIDSYSKAIDMITSRAEEPPVSETPGIITDQVEKAEDDEEIVRKKMEQQKLPEVFHHELSIYYSNRAACYIAQNSWELAVEDCTKALELQPKYIKALLRRAKAYESLDKLEEALQAIVELDPSIKASVDATKSLPPRITEKQERLKAEMMGQLKDIGNKFLGLFGLSTDNFQMVQDPASGGYSVNFKK